MKEWLLSIPQAIADHIRALFEEFFMPDEEKSQAKLDAIKAKFAFVFQVQELGEDFIDMLKTSSGSVPPSFTINLGDKADGIWGTQTITIDFAWYVPYKASVDAILSGVIWLKFLWTMYCRIPSIIRGESISAGKIIDKGENG